MLATARIPTDRTKIEHNRVRRELQEAGPGNAAALEAAADMIEADRPFLDWFVSGRALELVRAIIELYKLIRDGI